MNLGDFSIGSLPGADAVDEVGLMPLVWKVPLVLVNHSPALDDDLPTTPMPTEVHHRLGAVDLDPCGRGCPVRPLVTVAHLARELAQVGSGIAAFAGH